MTLSWWRKELLWWRERQRLDRDDDSARRCREAINLCLDNIARLTGR